MINMKIIRNQPFVAYNEAKIIEGIETAGQTENKKVETTPSTRPPGPIIMKND